MKRTVHLALVLAIACIAFPLRGAAQDQPSGKTDEAVATPLFDQETLDKKFEEMLTGTAMLGFFTELSTSKLDDLKMDKYRIDKVTKGKNGYWVFDSQVQYRGNDIAFRMPVRVEWAGDTPVITLNNLPAPGLGVFTARVMFYDGLYAGTWSGHDHGGHMIGRVVKLEDLAAEEAKAAAESKSDDTEKESSTDTAP